MNDEEAIKKRIIQQRLQDQAEQQVQQQQLQEAMKDIIYKILDPKARERLTNIKLVKPDLAMQLGIYLSQLYQMGHIKIPLTEAQLIEILKKIGEKKEFKIRRK